MVATEALEKPLPKPRRDPVGYAAARTLESLLEALLALEFLDKGYTRNAAGKAFQAWRALTAAILSLERGRVLGRLRDEERRWFTEKGLPRVPSTRLKALGQLVEELGYPSYAAYTAIALDLHDYQYHGPDPDAELSKYTSRGEAAKDIVYVARRIVELIEGRVKPLLDARGAWSDAHEAALRRLKDLLKA